MAMKTETASVVIYGGHGGGRTIVVDVADEGPCWKVVLHDGRFFAAQYWCGALICDRDAQGVSTSHATLAAAVAAAKKAVHVADAVWSSDGYMRRLARA